MATGPYLTEERFCGIIRHIDKLLAKYEADPNPRYKKLIKKCEAAIPQLKEYMEEAGLCEPGNGSLDIIASAQDSFRKINNICSELFFQDFKFRRERKAGRRVQYISYNNIPMMNLLMQDEKDLEGRPYGKPKKPQSRSALIL